MTVKTGCVVCDTLPVGDLVELDLLLADPLRWPSTIWRGFEPPAGALPASYRRFGAMEMGHAFLAEHGYELKKSALRRHLRYDVPVIDVDVDDLVARGLIAQADGRRERDATIGAAIDPLAYVGFYNSGIQLGQRGLELLGKRVDQLIERKEDVPLALIKMIVDAGLKLATSQATIKSAGRQFGGGDEDEDDGFRVGGDEQKPSMKVGHQRVRTIDGVARPVTDEGPADRDHFNARMAQEGGPGLGGRR